jgi:hypothetical protein
MEVRARRKLVRPLLLPEFLGVNGVLGAARSVLVAQKRRPADEVDGKAIQIAGGSVVPRLVETHASDGRHQVNAVWLVTELNHFSRAGQILGGYVEAAEPELRESPQHARCIFVTGANQEIDVRRVPRKSVPRDGQRANHQIFNFVRVQALDKLSQVAA